MPTQNYNIFLSIHNKTINFFSEELITSENPIFSLKVPEEMSYRKFGDLVEGSKIWVYEDSDMLLKLSQEFHLGISSDQMIEVSDDPHFQLLCKNSKIPIPILLYQYSMNVYSNIEGTSVEKPTKAVEPITIMNVKEVAKMLRLSPRTVMTRVSKNDIPVKRVGRKLLFVRETLLIWLNDGVVFKRKSGNKT